ncbi:MAG: hypothetical protein VW292_11770, partial [Alphaproteobacteria bacterium]
LARGQRGGLSSSRVALTGSPARCPSPHQSSWNVAGQMVPKSRLISSARGVGAWRRHRPSRDLVVVPA